MRFQLLSHLWGKVPANFRARAPLLILAGNVGGLESPGTWALLKVLTCDFDKVFWIPHTAETFTKSGEALSDEAIRTAVHGQSTATLLSNDIVTYDGQTIIATSGWWPGVEAPLTKQVCKWGTEDVFFVHENSSTDSIVITAGGLLGDKSHTIINGTPHIMGPNYNRFVRQGRHMQRQISNSALSANFHAERYFELA